MTNRRFSRKLYCIVVLLVFLSVCPGFCPEHACASGETEKTQEQLLEEIKAYRNSVIRVESICWDGEAEIYSTRSFSGFVVSEDTSGIYAITVNNGITYTSKEKEELKSNLGLEDNARISEKIEVIFNGDLRIEADIVGESDQRNLTVLKLNQSVNFGNVLQFAEKNASDKEQLFLLSYPESVDRDGAIYNVENVMITPGIARNSYRAEEVLFLKHDIQADAYSIGGPILNEDGAVAGMFLLSRTDEESGLAVGCETLKSFLNTLNISYQEHTEITSGRDLPVLNLILGAIIVVLLIIVIVRLVRGRSVREIEPEHEDRRAGRKRAGNAGVRGTAGNHTAGGNAADNHAAKRNAPEPYMGGVSAGLEFPAGKRTAMIHKESFLIGRSQEADFVLSESRGVSRKHACIQTDGRNYYLMDLQSRNHTYLNGEAIPPEQPQLLHDGDEIMAGSEKLVFHCR